VPFLRLTRDRRGFENTFLLHADQPGERPRLLYWYRTAPGVALGRAPLDEEAIRTIEDQHPNIDFDWPAILALGEVMIHEEEAPARPQQKQKQRDRRRDQPREQRQQRPADASEPAEPEPVEPEEPAERVEPDEVGPLDPLEALDDVREPEPEPVARQSTHGLLDELVGREIATRLRARHAEILTRIHQKDAEPAARDQWLRQAEALDPDLWVTPEQILKGVSSADALFEKLRNSLNS
jgi:hypothetical protein